MAYIVAADLRASTQKWWTKGITLETSDIADTDLTALIASMSLQFDRDTDDHFEPETAITVTVDGESQPDLWVPKRIRTVTTVVVTLPGGAQVTVPNTSFTFEPFTGEFFQLDHESKLSLLPGLYLWPGGWPAGEQNVAITGNFSWPACPDDVKRAIALMCWDTVKNWNPDMRRATRENLMDGTSLDLTVGDLPDVTRIKERYCRRAGLQV